jgi:hypothetical protein
MVDELERILMKQLRPKPSTILVFAWRDSVQPRTISVRIAGVPAGIKKNTPPLANNVQIVPSGHMLRRTKP